MHIDLTCFTALKKPKREPSQKEQAKRARSKPESASYSREYCSWANAKQRCTNPKAVGWKDYGGRGIKMLFASFEEFYRHVGPKPKGQARFVIDRIDNDGHYEPGNVRWTTYEVSATNRRAQRNPYLNP